MPEKNIINVDSIEFKISQAKDRLRWAWEEYHQREMELLELEKELAKKLEK